MAVRIHLLGSFEVVHDGRAVDVGGPVGRAILAVLACPPDTKVLPEQLIAAVWGSPGAVTADNLYRHVTRLRQLLAQVGLGIVGHRPGYRLPVSAEQVDAIQFDELLRTARSVADIDPDQAVDRLVAALALWRGPRAVDNLTQPGIRRIAAALDARRLDAEEDLADLELLRGRPEGVLDRLHTLTAAHPHRPRLTAALVRALHATGRTDEAVSELRKAEQAAGEHGLHPALADARQAIAGDDCGGRQRRPAARPSTAVPFQLPADTVHFTGRVDHLTLLRGLWPTNRDMPATVVISAVAGMAGVGKTALAVHAAHQLADQFDDGVLFIDLRGFTPGANPVTPDDALDYLLRGLGVPGDRVPPGLAARAALYRTVLARRRVLVVLDNAADETQVQPLLPATPGCLVVVTSRKHLAGLDDAVHLSLPSLPLEEATALFRALVADRATPADEHTIEHIVALCGRLPLAIRIAAARLRFSRAGTPARLLAELADMPETGHGLDRLSDGHRAVATALDVSYHHLTGEQRHAFRLLGVHPGTDIEPYTLAALADTTLHQAQQLLDHLHAVNLIEQPNYRRYALHDLVAAYATALAHQDPEPDQHAALNRLFDLYAHTTAVAMNLFHPNEIERHTPTAATPTPPLDDPDQARAWLDTELDNLLAAAHDAPNRDRPDHTIHQSTALHRHLRIHGRYTDANTLHSQALHHARETGNRAGEHKALYGLGEIHLWQNRYEQAADCYEQVLTIARETRDRHGEHAGLHGLGNTRLWQNRYQQAVGYLEQALTIAQETGNRTGEQETLVRFGDMHRQQGRYEQALDCYEQVLTIARETGDRTGEHAALYGLGEVHMWQGRYQQATEYFERAFAIAHETGNRTGGLHTLARFGRLHRAYGRYGPATDCYQQVLTIARDIGDRHAEETALHGLGRVHWTRGRYEPAADYFRQMLAIARDTGDRICEQAALSSLGDVHRKLGQYGPAADHYQQVLTIADRIGLPNWQFEAHHGLGRTHHATGRHHDAFDHHHTALDLATELEQPIDQARAHDGLANALRALDDTTPARRHWHAALNIFASLEHADEPDVTTAAIQAQLAGLDNR